MTRRILLSLLLLVTSAPSRAADLTFALDGDSYRFLGFGVSSPLYEKGGTLTNYAGDLTESEWDRLCTDCLEYFSWLRVHTGGGEFYREGASGRNYPAKKQAALFRDLLHNHGPYRIVVSPFSAPSATMEEGDQDTLRPNGTDLPAGQVLGTAQQFTASDANWQLWLDATDHGVKSLIRMGGNVEQFETPNEFSVANGPQNFWQVNFAAGDQVDYVNKVWLGEGLTGGGIKDRYPWLVFVEAELDDTIAADGTAGPEVTYRSVHNYVDGITGPEFGVGSSTSRFGKVTLGEWGRSGTPSSDGCRRINRTIHQAIVYGRTPLACYWASLRDSTVKAVADSRGQSYSARGLANLTTASGTFALEPLWWTLKPQLVACGRGEADVLCAAAQTAVDGDADFTPAAGVYANVYHRATDGKWGVVYANFSGGSTTDSISFTDGGNAADLSGTRTDFLPLAGSGNEGTPSAASTTAGAYSLGSVANNTVVLLELEETP